MFLTAKSIKNAAQKSSIDIVHLINDGQTDGGVQFDGTVEKRDFPVNTNKFTVLSDRSYNLFQAGSVSIGGDPPLPGETFPTFNNYDDNISSAKHFKLSLPVPATLQYSASTGNDPTNYYPFVVIGYTNLDGNAGPSGSTGATEITACISSMLKYDDA